MSNLRTRCESCGAPVDLYAKKCAYCDTPYATQCPAEKISNIEAEGVRRALEMGLLTPNEVVHYVNRDKIDSLPENLKVFASQAEHMREGHPRTKGVMP